MEVRTVNTGDETSHLRLRCTLTPYGYYSNITARVFFNVVDCSVVFVRQGLRLNKFTPQ